MGFVNSQKTFRTILPEIFVLRGERILLVEGEEDSRLFWWPPGAYWGMEHACDLSNEEPSSWIERLLREQAGVGIKTVRLWCVEMIDEHRAPVFVYKVEPAGAPSPGKGFLDARFFHVNSLPQNLGRDEAHKRWLERTIKSLLS